jgi:hypothetical protein
MMAKVIKRNYWHVNFVLDKPIKIAWLGFFGVWWWNGTGEWGTFWSWDD